MNLDLLANPKSHALRSWMSQLLGDRYPKHERLLDHVANSLSGMNEVQDFGKLGVDLYELGYLKCLNDYKVKLDALGIKVSLVAEQPKTN